MRPTLIALTIACLMTAGCAAPIEPASWPSEASAAGLVVDPASASTITTDSARQDDPGTSKVEEATGQHYQHDANVHGDAQGTCEGVESDRLLEADADQIPAMLVEHDDEADAFHVPLGSAFVGERLRLDLLKTAGSDLFEVGFDIVDADCGFSVFDSDADIYHPGASAPSQPFDPRLGHDTRDFEADDDHDCDADEWKFLLKHRRGTDPGPMYVQWSNGDYTFVAPDEDPSQVSKYLTSYNVEHTVARIAFQLPVDFHGRFQVAHGPCNLVEAEPPQAPSTDADGGEFTVVEAGDYVLIITLERGIVESATGLDPVMRCHPLCGYMAGAMGLEIDLHSVSSAS